jgi:hypothetical protein
MRVCPYWFGLVLVWALLLHLRPDSAFRLGVFSDVLQHDKNADSTSRNRCSQLNFPNKEEEENPEIIVRLISTVVTTTNVAPNQQPVQERRVQSEAKEALRAKREQMTPQGCSLLQTHARLILSSRQLFDVNRRDELSFFRVTSVNKAHQ